MPLQNDEDDDGEAEEPRGSGNPSNSGRANEQAPASTGVKFTRPALDPIMPRPAMAASTWGRHCKTPGGDYSFSLKKAGRDESYHKIYFTCSSTRRWRLA